MPTQWNQQLSRDTFSEVFECLQQNKNIQIKEQPGKVSSPCIFASGCLH